MCQHKGIYGVADPRFVLHYRWRVALGRQERPMFFPLGALGNPGLDRFDLFVGKLHAGRDRWHPHCRLFCGYTANYLALFRMAFDYRALPVGQCAFSVLFAVKTKWNVLGLSVSAMTGITFIGKN